MKKLLLTTIVLIIGIIQTQAQWFVDIDATGNNDGTSWTDAYREVQDAIANASANDEVWIAQGTYYPTEDIIGNNTPANSRVKTILVNKDIDIYGGFNGTETQLSQRDWELNVTLFSGDIGVVGVKTDNCVRVVFVTSNSMIDGISIKDAYISGGYGGAINVNGSEFSLNNCTISDNETNSGAGMYIEASSSINVDNCKFYDNVAENKGGAIYLESGKINVTNSVFDGNTGYHGGAILLQGNTPDECSIVNSLFLNNETTTYGGAAVYAFEIPAGVKIINSTFAKNGCSTCPANNSGTIGSNGVNFNIQNTIVWDSIPLSESNNNLNKFTINNSVINGGFTGNNNVSTYPLFTDTAANNYTLQSGSVAINTGDSTNYSSIIPLFDLEENSRYFGSSIDMGCYENQGTVCTVNIPDANLKTYLVGNTAINTNGDGEIQCSEASAFTGNISCNNLGISNLTGIEAFVNITQLHCSNNNLTDLTLSVNFPNLIWLVASSNLLSNVDISGCTALEELNFNTNNLTSIDLSNNLNLTYVSIPNNDLTSLDISSNTSLAELSCGGNNLLDLNLANGNNTNFTFLAATQNPNLTCVEVDDVTYSTANWSSFVDATASFSTNCSQCTVNIPDANFKTYLVGNTAINTNGDGEIQCSEASAFSGAIFCSSLSISDLTGLESFTGLTQLICHTNQISVLDVSSNLNLTKISCGTNLLTGIDVTANNNLTQLSCQLNQLTNLEFNSNLTSLFCQSNKLTSLDMSNNIQLTSLQIRDNLLTNLNVANGNNTIINGFYADQNPNLSCIQVDDAAYSTANWTFIDTTTSFSTNCPVVSPVLVNSISVKGQANISTITTNGGTLQMEATILPANADDATYTWSVVNGTGSASISVTGLLTATADGTVDVIATANDASGITGTKTITISNQSVGINTLTFKNLNIYPNPTNGIINLNVSETLSSVKLINITGKTLKRFNLAEKQLDISEFALGVYFLEILSEEKKSVIQIIKK